MKPNDSRNTLAVVDSMKRDALQTTGFRFLIMEKMEAPFNQVVSDIGSGKRTFAAVATHLISLVEAVHARKLLVIDIKPDNFMVSSSGTIVMIDLGLVQSYASLGGHRPNNKTGGGVVGTPLYASLNLFEGQTASRRDDLEALLYLLMEMTLRITFAKELPWSHGKSEEEIGNLKRFHMIESKGDVWKSFGTGAGRALRAYFDNVRSLGYSQKPDYDALRKLIEKIPLEGKRQKRNPRLTDAATADDVTTSRRTTATSRRAAAAAASPQILTRKRPSQEKLVGSPSKKHEVADVVDDDSSSIDDPMDWEAIKERIGVSLLIDSGAHKGEMVHLIQGEQESVVFGISPDDPQGYILLGDPAIALVHAHVSLHVTKRLLSVLVKDLKSSDRTWVGKVPIRSGKSMKAFLNDTIILGETRIKIIPLRAQGEDLRSDVDSTDIQMHVSREKENAAPNATTPQSEPLPKARGFRLEFTAGPHQGDKIVLQDGMVDTVVVGANPPAKSGHCFRLEKDSKVTDSSLVRFELDASRKGFCSLRVIDLKSQCGIRLNGIEVGKGKKETAFANDSLVFGSSVVQIKPL